LEPSVIPINIAVVGDRLTERGSHVVDRILEYAQDGRVERPDFLARKRIPSAPGIDTGSPQGLGSVDVPKAGDPPLVHQQGLNRGTRRRDDLLQMLWGEFEVEWIYPEIVWKPVSRVLDRPQATRVDEVDLPAIKVEDKARMLLLNRGSGEGEPAGHAQMNDEISTTREAKEDVLPSSFDSFDRLADDLMNR